MSAETQNGFKPQVEQWGQRGILECAKILDQLPEALDDAEEMARREAAEEAQDEPSRKPISRNHSGVSDLQPPVDDDDPYAAFASSSPIRFDEDAPKAKKMKIGTSTIEEYEAMLDAEGEGGYLEGGDVA